jgi:pimeloyl-ACP methyl ester carboxylesterase
MDGEKIMRYYPQINYIKYNNATESYRMYYTSWGIQEKSQKTLICVHGLNRNGRDFDYIGEYFATKGYFVVCPDIIGRGNSDFLKDPMQYILPNYCKDVLQLITVLNLKNIDYIGVSMGGIIAMAMLQYNKNIFNSLVLVDIGGKIEMAGIQNILNYSVNAPKFSTFGQIFDYVKSTNSDFGDLPEEVWEAMVLNVSIQGNDGMFYLKRDVNLSIPFMQHNVTEEATNLWPLWEAVNIPTLIIRGEHSNILSKKTVNQMLTKANFVETVEIARAGHAPYLYSTEHMQTLEKFFQKNAGRNINN